MTYGYIIIVLFTMGSGYRSTPVTGLGDTPDGDLDDRVYGTLALTLTNYVRSAKTVIEWCFLVSSIYIHHMCT